ncbi:MAG: primosomal protein N', partial [Thermoanaerobaculia bacterium]|nr:primosomal protein N' [Thermoanaerobaculia bacterium]
MTERWFEVAVPLPILEPLTYAGPPHGAGALEVGMRVRVSVGRRRLVGVVVGITAEKPTGFVAKPIVEVLDSEPVLPSDLIDLARFTADYYLTPIGPVVKSMLPAKLEPWGDRKVRITDRGALALPRTESQRRVLEYLRSPGVLRLAELRDHLNLPDLGPVLDQMAEQGWIRMHSAEARRGVRYRSAVELGPGEIDELVEKVGRSRPGRAIVHYLRELGRPASIEEVCQAAECTPGVPQRLIKLGVLRRFTEIQRLDLGDHRAQSTGSSERLVLRPDQAVAVEAIQAALSKREYKPFLLAGMTGSGKTEVYLRAAEAALAQGRGTLIMVPEIALVPALAAAAGERFGHSLAVLHSGLGASERKQEWERVRSGEALVVLGARSALFAPVRELGLIVVDEEQDSSYKQDTAPRYNGRDLALVRGSGLGAVVLLASATPSLETRFNVEAEKLERLQLTHRAGHGSLPDGILVDLRTEATSRQPGEITFSAPLMEEIRRALDSDEQIILLRNRRGYAPTLLCRACGEDHRCEDCGLPRTLHRQDGTLVCHYCGSRRRVPHPCEKCDEDALEAIGAGTQRVEERFREMFPGVPVAVLDRDTVQRRGGVASVLDRFGRGDDRVLIGTQMVSKGHHFPKVGLAAVLAADSYLGFPDFRAVERTYN